MKRYIKNAEQESKQSYTTEELASEPAVVDYLDELTYNYTDEYDTYDGLEVEFYITDSKLIGDGLYELTGQADIGYEDNFEWVDESFSFKVSYDTKTGELDPDYEDEGV